MKRILSLTIILIAFGSSAQVPSYVPQNGLKCYWPFSGNTNDVSANASHLTNNNAVLTADRNGVPNAAYSFNGSNQSMIRTNPSFTFSSTSSFTVSVWISKTGSAGGVAMINATTAANNFIWLLQGSGSSMSYGTNKQQSAWINLSDPITMNTWIHHVCVYNNGLMTYYQDNVVVGTATFPYTSVTSANLPLFIGKGINGGFYSGKIDDIGIWDRALSTCEIGDLFNATSTVVGVNAGTDVTVCAGQPVTLTGSGPSSLMWDNGVLDGVSFTPLTSATYTLTGTDGSGCTGWDQVDVTVNQGAVDGGPDLMICDGTPVTLTATGATGISWDNGVTDGVSFIPSASQTYTVSGTDISGCTGVDQVLVTLYQPVINAGSDITICAGDSVLFDANGGDTYVWNNNAMNGTYVVPSVSGTFSVVGTDTAGCSNADSMDITVDPLSNIQAGPDVNICTGQTIALSATGGLFYIWNNGIVQNSPFTPPSGTTAYVVTGADSSNCYNSDTVLVTVNVPTSSTLTISALDQYTLNGQTFSASGTYTQVINNAFGCDSTITLDLTLAFTGLDETDKYDLSWYPNPASDVLNVKIAAGFSGREMKIFASDARLVKTIILTGDLNKIQVEELDNGIYTCRIDGVEQLTFRWMKE